jgi:hypothetical protein
MFTIKGNIKFDPVNLTKKHNNQSSWKKTAIVNFSCDTADYYSWFLKKRFNLYLSKPIRSTHFTVINDKYDNSELWNQYVGLLQDKEIRINYYPELIRTNGKHWWIKADSDDARNIRSFIGLDPNPYFGFHITIGIANHLQEIHSNYIMEQCIKFNL